MLIRPKYTVRVRNSNERYSIGIPKKIAEQITGDSLELSVENGKIVLKEKNSNATDEL